MSNLAVYLAMLLLGSSFSSSTVVKSDQPAAIVQMGQEEQRFIDLVNSERVANGMSVLKIDPTLVEVSRAHSKEMCDKSYFNHVSPTSGLNMPLDRYLAMAEHRPRTVYLGENLFYCSIVDVNRGHVSLMNSPSHRENIMNPKFELIGVGVYKNEAGEFWVTEMFLTTTG
jgi:uncharacterized protein YkwD